MYVFDLNCQYSQNSYMYADQGASVVLIINVTIFSLSR